MADSSDSEEYLSAEDESSNDKGATSRSSTTEHGPGVPVGVEGQSTRECADDGSRSTRKGPPLGDSNRTVGEESGVEFVSNLDNRYVSESTGEVTSEQVELTEEQIKEMKEQATKLKELGNQSFKEGDHHEAIKYYTEALGVYPLSYCQNEVAICHANRGACYIKLEQHEDVIDDCTKALELKPDYLKALVRRAHSYEALDKLEQALEDYKKILELDSSQPLARAAIMRLPAKIEEQHEKMKTEMIGQLKELGNTFLKPFGLSTDNFQLQKDPNTGGYSVNFQK